MNFNRYIILAYFSFILSLVPAFAGHIHDLIEAGEPYNLLAYVENNPESIHDRDEEGNTPLHLAAKKGDVGLVEYLLKRGAQPYLKNHRGQIPITLTNNGIIREILRKKMVQSFSALTIDGHNIEATRETLSTVPPEHISEAVNQVGRYGNTPLICTARYGTIEGVKLLLEFHATVDQGDFKGTTPLMIAAGHGRVRVVAQLLESGASVDLQDADGQTALMYAAGSGNINIVTQLLKSGASIDLQDAGGKTALMNAARNGHIRIVTRLLEMAARADRQDETGHTALMCAVISGKVEVVRVLLEKGVGCELRNSWGKTAGQLAVDIWQNSKPEIVEMFQEIQEISEVDQSSEWFDHFETPGECLSSICSFKGEGSSSSTSTSTSSSSSSSSSSREEVLPNSRVRSVRSFIYDPQNENQIANPEANAALDSSSSGFTLQSARLLEQSKPTSTYRQKRPRPEARFVLR